MFEIRDICWSRHDSPAGPLTIASAGGRICFMGFLHGNSEEIEAALQKEFTGATIRYSEGVELHSKALEAVLGAAVGQSVIPVVVAGTPFQQAVWRELAHLTLGERICYSELAARVGHPSAVRAVASAVARNRIAPLIPCHRIIKASGEAGQYRWGAETKLLLLRLEQLRIDEVGGADIALDIVAGSLPGTLAKL